MPLALSFDDTGGCLRAFNVADAAAVLGVMTGVDPTDARADPQERGEIRNGLHALPEADAPGERIGIARDFMGQDAEVD